MCFGIRISSPFYLGTLQIHIQNLKCPKNAKKSCEDITLLPGGSQFRDPGPKLRRRISFIIWLPIHFQRAKTIQFKLHFRRLERKSYITCNIYKKGMSKKFATKLATRSLVVVRCCEGLKLISAYEFCFMSLVAFLKFG